MNQGPQRFAVFGHPVTHSQSPLIHAEFARQAGIALDYAAIDASPDGFAAALAMFAAGGGRGANVTLPLKELAATLCSELGDHARIAGAANMLTRLDDPAAGGPARWRGDNTDGIGFMHDISDRARLHVRGRRALLLGAGGAAHGVAPALLDAGVRELVVCNRTPERADRLVDSIGDPERAHSRYWNTLGDIGSFDLIVNATSAGRSAQPGDTGPGDAFDLPYSLAGARCVAYDLNYGEAALPFLAWARSAGAAHSFDGLGMLVEQAAESFERWHGHRPDTDAVYAQLRERAPALHTGD